MTPTGILSPSEVLQLELSGCLRPIVLSKSILLWVPVGFGITDEDWFGELQQAYARRLQEEG